MTGEEEEEGPGSRESWKENIFGMFGLIVFKKHFI